MFINAFITTAIIVTSIIVGICNGSIETLSMFVSIGYICVFIISFYILVVIGFKENYWVFIKGFIPYFICFISLIVISLFMSDYDNIFISLTFKTFLCVIVWCICLFYTGGYKTLQLVLKR